MFASVPHYSLLFPSPAFPLATSVFPIEDKSCVKRKSHLSDNTWNHVLWKRALRVQMRACSVVIGDSINVSVLSVAFCAWSICCDGSDVFCECNTTWSEARAGSFYVYANRYDSTHLHQDCQTQLEGLSRQLQQTERHLTTKSN